MVDRWTAKSYSSFEDAKHGEWTVIVVNEGWPIDHFYISRSYSSGAQPYGWARNIGIVRDEVSAYSGTHQRLATPSKYHVDAAGQFWIVAHNTTDEWYGVTLAYGGLVFYSESYSELDGAITKFSLEKKASGAAPPPVTPPPVLPKPSPITDDTLRHSAGIASALGMRLSDLLLVEYAECGLNTTKINPTSGARGLVQLMRGPAQGMGLSDAQYDAIPSMSFGEQQEIAAKFFRKYGKGSYPDAVRIYQTVFAPGTVGVTDAMYPSGSAAYKGNAYYDFDHDGVISTADLATVLRRRAEEKAYKDVIARVKALGLGTDPVIGEGSTGGGSSAGGGGSTWMWIAGAGLLGAGYWYWSKSRSTSPSARAIPEASHDNDSEDE